MKRISLVVILLSLAIIGGQAMADNTAHAFLYNRVSLTLDRTDVEAVVRMLAKQHGFNVAIAGEVTGEASMILNNVPLHEALDAILTCWSLRVRFFWRATSESRHLYASSMLPAKKQNWLPVIYCRPVGRSKY